MSEVVNDFDKMMSEIMAKKNARESDQDLLDRKDVVGRSFILHRYSLTGTNLQFVLCVLNTFYHLKH